ncbi:hypothetical protein HY374_00695 [Candidatus Berkelbacteria bacterium]|nr:hypothetical protein [Candidatus Berkelbacteria bacterium]
MIWWVTAHVIGTVLGVGAATINDVLFMRAIGSTEEGEAYRRYNGTLSLVAWVGITILAASAMYFWIQMPGIHGSEKILTKIGLTALLALNGLAMHMLLRPRVMSMKPADWKDAGKLDWVKSVGVPLGVLSAVSWYTALILGAVGRTSWGYEQILPYYFAALIGGIVVGRLLVDYKLKRLR